MCNLSRRFNQIGCTLTTDMSTCLSSRMSSSMVTNTLSMSILSICCLSTTSHATYFSNQTNSNMTTFLFSCFLSAGKLTFIKSRNVTFCLLFYMVNKEETIRACVDFVFLMFIIKLACFHLSHGKYSSNNYEKNLDQYWPRTIEMHVLGWRERENFNFVRDKNIRCLQLHVQQAYSKQISCVNKLHAYQNWILMRII